MEKSKVHWVVEHDVFEDDTYQRMVSAIRSSGFGLSVCTYLDSISSHHGRWTTLPDKACAICWGSLNFVRAFNHPKYSGWVPGASWCDFKQFACVNYFAHWGEHLLNNYYAFIPFGDLRRKKDDIFERFGDTVESTHREVFIRPDSGTKGFTGGLATEKELEDEILSLDLNPASLVVIAQPKRIDQEWRFVVANREVVAASLYKSRKSNGLVIDLQPYPSHEDVDAKNARQLAEEIAKGEWQPSLAYTLDICKTEEGFRLLELNSFNCADFYKGDASEIVDKVSTLAYNKWMDHDASSVC